MSDKKQALSCKFVPKEEEKKISLDEFASNKLEPMSISDKRKEKERQAALRQRIIRENSIDLLLIMDCTGSM